MKPFTKKKPVNNKGSFYTSIHKLPLSRFIDIYIDKDLQAMVIDGTPTTDDLQRAWEVILEEYGDALASNEQLIYLKKCAELQKKTLTYNIAVSLIEVLRKSYVESFAKRLNAIIGTAFKFDISNKEGYMHELTRCGNRLKEQKIKIEILENHIENMLAKYSKELKTPAREDFQNTLITLSDFAGRELDENNLTVYSYCERLKRYNKWVEQKQKEQQTQKSQSLTR